MIYRKRISKGQYAWNFGLKYSRIVDLEVMDSELLLNEH